MRDLTQLLNNRGWVFEDVHPQYTIVLASFAKTNPQDNETLAAPGTVPQRGSLSPGMMKEPLRFTLKEVLARKMT